MEGQVSQHSKASAERFVNASTLTDDAKAKFLQLLQTKKDPDEVVQEVRKSATGLSYETKIQGTHSTR